MELRFTPEAADDAAGWVFHPLPSIEREPEAALLVRFRAGGVQEMCWHLFTWGPAVTVVAPRALRQKLGRMAAEVAAHCRDQGRGDRFAWGPENIQIIYNSESKT